MISSAVAPGRSEVIQFSEGNLFVRIGQNVRGRHVYLVQSTVFPANDHFVELLFWIDAFKRSSAASVTVVLPYFSYAKGDKKDEPRVSIRARVCAQSIEAAGADRVVDRGSARAPDPGLLRHPGGRPLRAAGAHRRGAAASACVIRSWSRPTPGSPRRRGSSPVG